MTDLIHAVNGLRRPRLLLNAAKIGLRDYNRARTLKRVAPTQNLTNPAGAVRALITAEETMEQARQARDASYTPSRHVEVLIALLAEVRALATPKLAS